MIPEMFTENKGSFLVKGYNHYLHFINGFTVYGWSAKKLTKSIAIKELIKLANDNGYANYEKIDIDKYSTID